MIIVAVAFCALNGTDAVAEDGADNVIKEYELSGFDGIKAGSNFEIEMAGSDHYSIVIEFPDELGEYLDVDVSNGDLILDMNFKALPKTIARRFENRDWRIKVNVNCPSVKRIRLYGAATLTMTERFNVSSVDIRTSGAASLDMALLEGNGKGDLSLEASGASHVELDLEGSFTSSDISCSGASNVYISGGNIEKCYVDNSGASDVDMESVGFSDLNLVLTAASQLYVSGTADLIDVDVRAASVCRASSLLAKRANVKASGASRVTVNAESLDHADISRASSFRNSRR